MDDKTKKVVDEIEHRISEKMLQISKLRTKAKELKKDVDGLVEQLEDMDEYQVRLDIE